MLTRRILFMYLASGRQGVQRRQGVRRYEKSKDHHIYPQNAQLADDPLAASKEDPQQVLHNPAVDIPGFERRVSTDLGKRHTNLGPGPIRPRPVGPGPGPGPRPRPEPGARASTHRSTPPLGIGLFVTLSAPNSSRGPPHRELSIPPTPSGAPSVFCSQAQNPETNPRVLVELHIRQRCQDRDVVVDANDFADEDLYGPAHGPVISPNVLEGPVDRV